MVTIDPTADPEVCLSPIAPGMTQPRWQVPDNASNIAAPGAGYERWRVVHSGGRCVDFFVAPAGKTQITPAAPAPRLPFQLLYIGGCTSPTRIDPGEKLVQTNAYSNFSVADQHNLGVPVAPACRGTRTPPAAAIATHAVAHSRPLPTPDELRGITL